MGDNLKAAAQFVQSSKDTLQSLMNSELSRSDMMSALATVQTQAKSMRARAIYRATQNVVDLVDSASSSNDIIAELKIVEGLINQYETGLLEITNESEGQDASKTAIIPQVKAQPAATSLQEACLLYTSPSPRDQRGSRMPSSA